MRITFSTVESFLSELSREAEGKHVWQNQVRFDIVSAAEQPEAISFKIGMILTALIDVEAQGQYILEAAFNCGSDDRDDDPPDAGTQKAKAMLEQVHRVAAQHGLAVVPGKLEAF